MHTNCFTTCCLFLFAAVSNGNELQDVRRQIYSGQYEEAEEQLSSIPTTSEQQLALAECKIQQGELRQAFDSLAAHLANNKGQAAIYAKAGHILFELGEFEKAKPQITQSLAQDANQPMAQFVEAELLRLSGKTTEASAIYEKLAKQSPDSVDVEQAVWIGRAITVHGRWSRKPASFDRLVNQFYPALLQREPKLWVAHLEIGKLFLEKYNEPEALRSFNAALAINPRSADIYLALAQLALDAFDFESAQKHLAKADQIAPQHTGVLRARADLALHNQQLEMASRLLAEAAEQCPNDEQTLGRQLAVYRRLDGVAKETYGRAAHIISTVETRNPHCGRFYAAAAEAFEAMRIYPPARLYYELSIKRLPEMLSERGKLGLVQMRLGEERAARETLEEAFRIDPFNVRVKNTLEVLDLLNRYAVIETEHFIVRFDRGQDQLLAEYASRYLEQTVYPDIVKSLGYQPTEKTLLEIFSRADGTSGHGWFSARMVGLPFIGTVGACAGKMFALTSPADGNPYNWARVLRHEFVHVVNLQQTDFQIPHWFTEALAVRNEGHGYPPEWETILAKFLADDQLFDLTNINHGFTRPGSSDRWTLAYYQAYLYADYIAQEHGEQALTQLLEQYSNGASTVVAIKHVTGKSVAEFETDYRRFLNARAKGFLAERAKSKSKTEWEAIATESANDDIAKANLARIQLAAGRSREARKLAEQALAINKVNSMANRVMAELLLSVGEDTRAWKFVEQGLKSKQPDNSLLSFAANRMLEDKKFGRAEAYFEQGQASQPQNPAWIRGLARIYLVTKNDKKLLSVLGQLADREPDKVTMARKLSQLTLRIGDFESAEKWANRVIEVDVTNALAHAQLAQAYAGQEKVKEAIQEYKTALRLMPAERTWQAALIRLQEQVSPT